MGRIVPLVVLIDGRRKEIGSCVVDPDGTFKVAVTDPEFDHLLTEENMTAISLPADGAEGDAVLVAEKIQQKAGRVQVVLPWANQVLVIVNDGTSWAGAHIDRAHFEGHADCPFVGAIRIADDVAEANTVKVQKGE